MAWSESAMAAPASGQSVPDMIWDLSGLPSLYRALSTRIAEDLGQAQIVKIASSAVTIAGSLQASDAITIGASQGHATMTMYDIQAEMTEIANRHSQALNTTFAALIGEHHQRADRVHANFVQRATHSLIAHLERNGEDDVWEYSPAGLRMLLRSAYNVYAARSQSTAKTRYEAVIGDLAELYARAFGAAVEGIEIAIPPVPDIPAPVVLGQTIALDFRDGWWTSWWRRTRGYSAFAKRFQKLIAAETEDFMDQLKTVQTGEIRDAAQATLQEFLEEQREILSGLGSRAANGGSDLQDLFNGEDETQRRKKLQGTMETLSRCAA